MNKFCSIILLLFILIGGFSEFISIENANKPQIYPLQYPSYFGNNYTISAQNPTTIEGVKLGRYLFYDTRLSVNEKISCASCHQQSKAFTDGEKISTGVDGQSVGRNAMSLTNLLWIKKFFWDGRAEGLEDQIKGPLTNLHEMGANFSMVINRLEKVKLYDTLFVNAFGDSDITQKRIEFALAQFERTLISCNSNYDKYLQGKYQLTSSEKDGMDLFFGNGNIKSIGCSHCHGGAKTYEELFANNGLDNHYKDSGRYNATHQSYDIGRFRTVTLRNIALTAPYMHDGRFSTLSQVIDHYSDHIANTKGLSSFLQHYNSKDQFIQLKLTEQEKKSLLSFLNILTDSTFIINKEFSNPFEL